MRYDKSGTGWGHGDVLYACDAKKGNCTAFHSLFIAMASTKASRRASRLDFLYRLTRTAPKLLDTTAGPISGLTAGDGSPWIASSRFSGRGTLRF